MSIKQQVQVNGGLPTTGRTEYITKGVPEKPAARKEYNSEIVWFPNVFGFAVMHALAIYGWSLVPWYPQVFLYNLFLAMVVSIVGVQMCAHRYYAHKTFKATLPLRVLMMFFNTLSSQNCLWVWVRDHRQHHKYCDTDADPHNATRGFFFSHMGWLLVRKLPEVIEKGRKIDMSDLAKDPLVQFQKRHYYALYLSASILAMLPPIWMWNVPLFDCFCMVYCMRVMTSLHLTWMVNSWAHAFGTKPYDANILPSDSVLVGIIGFGEGWHNYHHCFPWDYRASEYGRVNITTDVIDMFAKIGWAYDLKAASDNLVKSKILNTGDGTHLMQLTPSAE